MRIFVSSTCEDLAEFRKALVDIILMQQCVPVAMEYWPSQDKAAVEKCLEEVRASDLYIGVFARRYGFIPEGYGYSMTELEYRAAEDAGITKLLFFLDEKTDDWPKHFEDHGEQAERLATFLDPLKRRTARFFRTPDDLAAQAAVSIGEERIRRMFKLVQNADDEQKARAQAEKDRLRIEEEEAARQRKQARQERIVGSVPDTITRHFQDRVGELRELHGRLSDEGLRLALVCGRGGTGKSTLIAKLIRQVEEDWIKKPSDASDEVDSIVFVSLRETEFASPDTIVRLIARTLRPDEANELNEAWKNKGCLAEGLEFLFNRSLQHERRLIVLDNFETVLDDRDQIKEEFAALRQFIEASLEYRHAALLLVTSRQRLALSPDIEGHIVGVRDELSLEGGLPPDAAKELLRALDPDGKLGIRESSDESLDEVVRRCECIPRTLEALVGTVREHPTWTCGRHYWLTKRPSLASSRTLPASSTRAFRTNRSW